MQQALETLLEETSELLDALIPIVKRSIDALQHDLNPLVKHLDRKSRGLVATDRGN